MSHPYRIFEAIGIELEYMVVDAETLTVTPIVDKLLAEVVGEIVNEVERGAIAWSNELVLHVLEFKTNGPVRHPQAAPDFAGEVRAANHVAERFGACLLPTGAHPWMDPGTETTLWPHEQSAIYDAFNRIFGCQGHGWSNVQSHHLNLAFGDDEEFGRLHAALRVVLPILPALAASSPFLDGAATGLLDSRLEVYRHNCRRIPQVTGRVVPEPVYTAADYETEILQPLYRAIAPHDPEEILQEEWLNARGVIARFDRGSLELRVLDTQECPRADLAIAGAVWTLLQRLAADPELLPRQMAWRTEPLEALFLACVRDGEAAIIDDPEYLALFGWSGGTRCRAGELWRHLAENWLDSAAGIDTLRTMIAGGTLARRILRAAGEKPSRETLREVYRELARCLATNQLFLP